MGCADVAARIHANMCDDPGFGYSWEERYGSPSDIVSWDIDGRRYLVKRGDYDCSSSVITAWRKALEGTAYEGALDAATYTGNMRSVFVNSGLFEVWNTYATNAVRGDVYLNDSYHTAMCQDGGSDGVYGYDALSEFCINEYGTVYGGQRGDQTGYESYIHGYYSYPWNCTLHYNGKADGTSGNPSEIIIDPVMPPENQPRYNAMVNHVWLPDMVGQYDTGGSSDTYAGVLGRPIEYIAIADVSKYRVYTSESGWLPWVSKRGLSDLVHGAAGDGSYILRVEIPDKDIKYRVHTVVNGWLPWMVGLEDTGGSGDTYAGNGNIIDGIEITRI